MTPIADLVEKMLARGVPHDLIVEAIRAAELSGHSTRIPPEIPPDRTMEKRRAWDREYRRKRKAIPPDSTRIPPDSTRIPPESTNSATSFLLSSLDKDLDIKEGKKERNSRGSKIPPDWKPNDSHFFAGQDLGLTSNQVLDQAEDMRLWAQSNANRAIARKADWDLTFHSWLRRNKPKGEKNGHYGRKTLVEMGLELAEEARQRERELGISRPNADFRGH